MSEHFGKWFLTKDVPVPDEPDAWIVTATAVQDRDFTDGGGRRTVTLIRAHYPDLKYRLTQGFEREKFDAWLRIPPPPWLEGK